MWYPDDNNLALLHIWSFFTSFLSNEFWSWMWFSPIFIHIYLLLSEEVRLSVFTLIFHSFSLLIAVKMSRSPRPCSNQRLLEYWKQVCPLNNNPDCCGFTAASVGPPAKGEADGIEMKLQTETLHSRLVSRAISRMCKSNLNPHWELLYTENPSTAAEISKLQHEDGKWAIISWLLSNMKSKI